MKIDENDYLEFRNKNSKKKIAIIYGNCHTTAMRQLLCSNDEFNSIYAMYPIKAIQEVKDPEYFKGEVFSDCDLFIHQSIQKNNRYGEEFSSQSIIKRIKKSANIIAVPNVYHLPMCYFPQYEEKAELKNAHGGTVFFRDSFIDNGLESGKSIKEIVNDYKTSGCYSQDHISWLFDKFIEKVRVREEEWDIKISDFLIENKNKDLFYDPNHPTPIIIEYICKGILSRLGIECSTLDISKMKLLDDYQMPLCKDVIEFFGIKYNQDGIIRLEGKKVVRGKMRIEDYVKQYLAMLWNNTDFDDAQKKKSKKRYFLYRGMNILKKVGGK